VSTLPPRLVKVNEDAQSLLSSSVTKRSYFCVPEVLSQAGGPDQYSIMGILILRFLFGSSTIIPRSNLPLILEAKYSTTVVSVGYLNSLQALVSTLTGFAVGPVVSKLYKNNTASMVKSAGILKTVSVQIQPRIVCVLRISYITYILLGLAVFPDCLSVCT